MARTDAFLKLDGIPGESQDKKHSGEIAILSFSFGASNEGSSEYGGGGGTGVAHVHDLRLSKRVDKASPLLFQHCASGKPIPKAILVTRKAGGDQQDYLTITLEKVTVSDYRLRLGDPAAASETVVPWDDFALNYKKCEIQYNEQKDDGSLGSPVKGLWDVKTASAS